MYIVRIDVFYQPKRLVEMQNLLAKSEFLLVYDKLTTASLKYWVGLYFSCGIRIIISIIQGSHASWKPLNFRIPILQGFENTWNCFFTE